MRDWLLDALAPALRSGAGSRLVRLALRAWVAAVARDDPAAALRRLLDVHDGLYERIDVLAIDLDGGVHAKHRLVGYHDFFIDRVQPGERVLDIGCGKGELAHDLAVRAGARVTGIDVNWTSLAFARDRFRHPEVEFIETDARSYVPDERFDVLVLSNVLEHLAERPQLLRRLVEATGAQRVLVRVPLLERDWVVALRRDLGLWYFSDPTHETEYDPDGFRAELREAGLDVGELNVRWGEIWAEARPSG